MKTPLTAPCREDVTVRAQQLWQLAGNPIGHDEELWLAAETEVNHERVEITKAADVAHSPNRAHHVPDGQRGGGDEPHIAKALLIRQIFCLTNGRHQPDKCRDEQAELFDKCGLNGIRHSLPKR